MKFKVNLCVTYVVEADCEEDAIEEAYRLLDRELESPYQSIYDIFGALAELED